MRISISKRILSFFFLCFLWVLSPIVTANSDLKQTLEFKQRISVDKVEFEKSKNNFINNSTELTAKLNHIENLSDILNGQIDTLNKNVQQYNLEIGKTLQARDDLKKQQIKLSAEMEKKQYIKNDLLRSVRESASNLEKLLEGANKCVNVWAPIDWFANGFCKTFGIKRDGFERDYRRQMIEYEKELDNYNKAQNDVYLNEKKINKMDQDILNHGRVHKEAELKMVKAKEEIKNLNTTSMSFLDLGERFRYLNMQMETSKFNDDPSVLYPLFLELNQKYEDSKEPLNALIQKFESANQQFLINPVVTSKIPIVNSNLIPSINPVENLQKGYISTPLISGSSFSIY